MVEMKAAPSVTIRQIEFELEKAEHGMGMPYDAERVGQLRSMLREARKKKLSAGLKARRKQEQSRRKKQLAPLILKRASASRSSGEWSDDDYDVLADGVVVGRIMKAAAKPADASWLWTLAYGQHKDRTPTHGYEATLRLRWRRSLRVGGGNSYSTRKSPLIGVRDSGAG